MALKRLVSCGMMSVGSEEEDGVIIVIVRKI